MTRALLSSDCHQVGVGHARLARQQQDSDTPLHRQIWLMIALLSASSQELF